MLNFLPANRVHRYEASFHCKQLPGTVFRRLLGADQTGDQWIKFVASRRAFAGHFAEAGAHAVKFQLVQDLGHIAILGLYAGQHSKKQCHPPNPPPPRTSSRLHGSWQTLTDHELDERNTNQCDRRRPPFTGKAPSGQSAPRDPLSPTTIMPP